MRYSWLVLWLKYVNREPRIAGMCIALLIGSMLSIVTLIVLQQLHFLVTSEKTEARVLGKRQALLLNRHTLPVFASLELFAHGKRGPRYLIQYEFRDHQGNLHRGEDRTAFSTWNGAKAGDVLIIRYSPSNPEKNRLQESFWDLGLAIPFAVLGPLVIFVGLWFGQRGIRWVNRQVWLIRHGEAIPGRIAYACVEYRGKKRKDTISVLDYEYATSELHKERIEMRGKLRQNWQTGTGLVVLIDPHSTPDVPDHAPDIFDARVEDRKRLFGLKSE